MTMRGILLLLGNGGATANARTEVERAARDDALIEALTRHLAGAGDRNRTGVADERVAAAA